MHTAALTFQPRAETMNVQLDFQSDTGQSQMLGPDVFGLRFCVVRVSTFTLVHGKQCTCEKRSRFAVESTCERHPIAHTFYWLRSEAGEDISGAVVGLHNANSLVSGRLERGRDV